MKTLGKVRVGDFTFKLTECNCSSCQSMCLNPCWPLPQEAIALIEAGYGDRLHSDFHEEYENGELILSVRVLAPRTKPDGKYPVCTFFTEGKCELHDTGLKPVEARILSHRAQPDEQWLRDIVGREWDSRAGQQALELWMMQQRKGN